MTTQIIEAVIFDEQLTLTLVELSKACNVHAEWILELVDEGIIDPLKKDTIHYHFSATCLKQALAVKNLHRDLGINLAGASLVLDLKQEIDQLNTQIQVLKCEQNR
jgi:chaperone modulatory protein CbpM